MSAPTSIESSTVRASELSPWRLSASVGAMLAAAGMASLLGATREVLLPAIVLGAAFVVTAVLIRKVDARWPLFAAMVLSVLTVAGNAPFMVSDLSHPESAAGFAPTVVILLAAVFTFAASLAAVRGASPSPRPWAIGGLAVGALGVGVSVAMSMSLSDDARQEGDIDVMADGTEYPSEIHAPAGEVGFFVENDDPIRHTFLIEGTDVKQELPGSTDRRVSVDLDPGTYRFYCDVPGHDDMEGTLVVVD